MINNPRYEPRFSLHPLMVWTDQRWIVISTEIEDLCARRGVRITYGEVSDTRNLVGGEIRVARGFARMNFHIDLIAVHRDIGRFYQCIERSIDEFDSLYPILDIMMS